MTTTPHSNPALEALVLGGLLDAEGPILRSTATSLLAATGVGPEDFTVPDLSAFVRAAQALAERGRPVDATTVFSLGKSLGVAQESALFRLRSLQGSNGLNREAFGQQAEELRRLTALRRLERFYAAQVAALARPGADPAAMAGELQSFANDFVGDATADETGESDVMELLDEWDAFTKGVRAQYVPTGIEVLDEAVRGFVPNLNVIGGRESVGKSALIAEIIWSCLERGLRVGVFGLEDATKWIAKRHLSRRLGIPVGDFGATNLNDWQRGALEDAGKEAYKKLGSMLAYRRGGITPEQLVQKCRRWVVARGVQAIFIDHGGEVRHRAGIARDRYDLAVAATYQQLRDLAVQHRVPVVVNVHFSRATDAEAGPPRLTHFAESLYIARMARLALGLWERDGDARLRCTVLKRSEGERGITVGIVRDAKHALVRRTGGEVIDLREESAREQAAAKEAQAKKLGARLCLPSGKS